MSADTESRPAVSSTEVGGGERRIVFLHGLFGRGKNFTQIAKALSDDATSLLVDMPNHGGSAWTEFVDFAEFADIIADHLRTGFAADGPVDVVGHSLGGKVAMLLALRHPDLVDRLVVVDISPTPASEADKEAAAEGKADGPGQFVHLLTALRGLDLDALTSRTDADEALAEQIPNDMTRRFLLQNLRRDGDGFAWEPNLALLHDEIESVIDFPAVDEPPFESPVLWVAGGESDYVRDDAAGAMRALFPKTVTVTVRGAGHWVHAEKPEEFTSILRTFFTGDR